MRPLAVVTLLVVTTAGRAQPASDAAARAAVGAAWARYRAAVSAPAAAADSALVGAIRAADSADARVGARPELLLLRGAATARLAQVRLALARRAGGCAPARAAAETAWLAWDRLAYCDRSGARVHAALLGGALAVRAGADSAVAAQSR